MKPALIGWKDEIVACVRIHGPVAAMEPGLIGREDSFLKS